MVPSPQWLGLLRFSPVAGLSALSASGDGPGVNESCLMTNRYIYIYLIIINHIIISDPYNHYPYTTYLNISIPYTLWLFDIAMENVSFTDDFPS